MVVMPILTVAIEITLNKKHHSSFLSFPPNNDATTM